MSRKSQKPLFHIVPVVVLILLAGLACNLQVGGDNGPNSPLPTTVQRPTVEILEPTEGASFREGQDVSVRARVTGALPVTQVELLVNGIRISSQVPNSATGEVTLIYKAQQPGTVILSVQASSNTIAGLPVQRTIIVLPELSPGQGGTGVTPQSQPTSAIPTVYNPQCRARVNESNLRFRTGPGTNYDIIGNLSAGNEPLITGYADRTDGRWWQVSWQSRTGWIRSDFATQLGECSNIRPAVVPASPTPAATGTPQITQAVATTTPTLPDLTLSMFEGVTNIQLGPDGTAQATYIIRVKNVGGVLSGQFRIAIAQPNGQTVTYDVPGLNPNQEFQVPSSGLTVTFNSSTPTQTQILVTVDDQNTIVESNENNNQAYKSITVSPGPATNTPQATIATG
ncbi:MAG: SH3 domain-containing protein [Chloroflexi bacterium]|nr:SH3 domain-containing protein [Chloroflexota bacterium]